MQKVYLSLQSHCTAWMYISIFRNKAISILLHVFDMPAYAHDTGNFTRPRVFLVCKLTFYFYLFLIFTFCLYWCECHRHESAHGDQKRGSDPLELKLWLVASSPPWKLSWFLYNSRKCSLTSVPTLQYPHVVFIKYMLKISLAAFIPWKHKAS